MLTKTIMNGKSKLIIARECMCQTKLGWNVHARGKILQLTEIWVFHGFSCCEALLQGKKTIQDIKHVLILLVKENMNVNMNTY